MSILKTTFSIYLFLCCWLNVLAQSNNLEIKQKKFRTSDGTIIKDTSGYLTVPENRSNPESRRIKVKFVHLKSLSTNPQAPVIYLEGGAAHVRGKRAAQRTLQTGCPYYRYLT